MFSFLKISWVCCWYLVESYIDAHQSSIRVKIVLTAGVMWEAKIIRVLVLIRMQSVLMIRRVGTNAGRQNS